MFLSRAPLAPPVNKYLVALTAHQVVLDVDLVQRLRLLQTAPPMCGIAHKHIAPIRYSWMRGYFLRAMKHLDPKASTQLTPSMISRLLNGESPLLVWRQHLGWSVSEVARRQSALMPLVRKA